MGCASSTGILPAGPDSYTVTEKLSLLRGGTTVPRWHRSEHKIAKLVRLAAAAAY
jgi:hypothetical protein